MRHSTLGIGFVLSSFIADGAYHDVFRPRRLALSIISSPPLRSNNDDCVLFSIKGLHKVRGGGNTASTKEDANNENDNGKMNVATSNTFPKLHVQAILIPRQTSILTPLRVLSFLLINISLNYCTQTAGKPMEDSVRRILNMPNPTEGSSTIASKVNQLHIYMAKKLLSSTSSSTSVEMLPPPHLPSPLPLLGLFLSIILYLVGTILAPKWSVHIDAFLNYERIDLNDEDTIVDASKTLSSWFDQQKEDDADPYYQTAKKPLVPGVLINDIHDESSKASAKGIICPLFLSPENKNESKETAFNSFEHYLDHPRRYYFEFSRKRYYYDPIFHSEADSSTPALIWGGPNLNELSVDELLSEKYVCGLNTESKLSRAIERYGSYSHISIPIPTLSAAVMSRFTSPLVALQIVGRLLSVLEDETIGKSVTNLMRLAFQHVSDAKHSIKAALTLASEVKENEDLCDIDNSITIWAVRCTATTKKTWVKVKPSDLFPGDVFILSTESGSSYFAPAMIIPVDSLLLEGSCVTEEAALTGESVPQTKVPLNIAVGDTKPSMFDMNGRHRSSCLFAGTQLLHESNDASDASLFDNLPPLPNVITSNHSIPSLFLTLRSGYYSSRGQIIQTLVKSKQDIGAVSSRQSQLDQLRLIGILFLFAAGACIHLLLESTSNSIFKVVVQCTRILVASVPSDLPVSLSALARECVLVLREQSDAVCSDPSALIESSRVDCIVFDKTGTLTSDTQSLVSLQHPPQPKEYNATNFKYMSDVVLASCHSLVKMNGTILGDPLDKACLDFSGWRYDSIGKSATTNDDSALWQIKSFPFDSHRKMASAIVMTKYGDTYHLLVVIKGAPNMLSKLFGSGHTKWISAEANRLGEAGHRTIALGVLDASDTAIARTLFPSGLPKKGSRKSIEKFVHKARQRSRKVQRNDIESHLTDIFGRKTFLPVGLASFDAPLRASTPMMINEFQQAGIELKMLTGDDLFTSLSVARKAGMISASESNNLFVLKLSQSGLLRLEVNTKKVDLALSRAKEIRNILKEKHGVLAVHGSVIQAILTSEGQGKIAKYICKELLPKATLITSASPDDKYFFVKWLRRNNGSCVLMCGDGVNDIAAMTEADVSVAMMTGFGYEESAPFANKLNDTDDYVRMDRLKRRRIGSNRNRLALNRMNSISQEEYMGIGESSTAATVRIQKSISDQLKNQRSNKMSPFRIFISSIAQEISRYKKLKKGGSDAARILAEEDCLRRSLQLKARVDSGNNIPSSYEEKPMIKTGEACLASSFTLLRPSIAGVETILRSGIAAASSSISQYRKIGLNCMLSCYNLATLYKNGLRYGKWMWQCELVGIIYTDRASFAASSTPRPKVANTRPTSSPFHPAETISTVFQAIIHIVTLTSCVKQGKQLDAIHNKITNHGFRIKWTSNNNEKGSVGAVLASLVDLPSSTLLSHDSSLSEQNFFRRSPFQPNYVANNVFIISVVQNAVIAMVNHPGKPFSVAFLESQPLCLSVGLSFLLCIVCITEIFPLMNRCLQLAPFPSQASKVAILRLILFNVSTNYFAEYMSTFLFRRDIWVARNEPQHELEPLHAADYEAKLLKEERARNISIVFAMLFCGFGLLLSHLIL